jgi:hypothetical protein
MDSGGPIEFSWRWLDGIVTENALTSYFADKDTIDTSRVPQNVLRIIMIAIQHCFGIA